MKKNLISNILFTLSVLLVLLILNKLLVFKVTAHYYVALCFFLITYLIQSFLIFSMGKTPSSFNKIYSITTMLKMLFSLGFLVFYFLFLENNTNSSETISFILFFLITYFIYLIFNTKLFFNHNNEGQ